MKTPKFFQGFLILGGSFVYLLFVATVFFHIIAELSYEKSLKYAKDGFMLNALKESEKSILFNPQEPRYFYIYARHLLLNYAPKEDVEKNLQTAIKLNPKNLATLRNSSPYFYFLAVESLENLNSFVKRYDPKYFAIAKNFLSELKHNYPTDAGVLVLVAKYEKSLNLQIEQQDTLQMIYELRKDLLDWHPEISN